MDQAFSKENFDKKVISGLDIKKYPALQIPSFRFREIEKAMKRAETGFDSSTRITKHIANSKTIYKLNEFSDELALRKVSTNLKSINPFEMQSRDEIISTLVIFLKESTSFRIYRLDIKSFYESIPFSEIVSNLNSNASLSRTTVRLLETLEKTLGLPGLPRGLSVSAVLAELYMSKFDSFLRAHPHVFFYARYVDDMILVTSTNETNATLIQEIQEKLKPHLTLNKKKQSVKSILDFDKSTEFNFLGYGFRINGGSSKSERIVDIDISNSKVKKLKTRINLAFRNYCKTKDFDLLHDRIKIFSSNFWQYDQRTGFRRKAGIYFNYKFINPEKSTALKELDNFLFQFIWKQSDGIGSQFGAKLTKEQKKTLTSYSVKAGFIQKRFFHFNRAKILKILECWNYA